MPTAEASVAMPTPASDLRTATARGAEGAAAKALPLRQASLNFLDIVDELRSWGGGEELAPIGAAGDAAGSRGGGVPREGGAEAAPVEAGGRQDSSPSGLSSGMEFDAGAAAAQSSLRAGGAADLAALSWSASEAAGGLAPAPLSAHASCEAPVFPVDAGATTSVTSCVLPENLFSHATVAAVEEEVMSMTFAGATPPGVKKDHELLDSLVLRREVPVGVDWPLAGFDGFEIRGGGVQSAPGLAANASLSGPYDSRASSPNSDPTSVPRAASVEVGATVGVKRAYSTAGPGTNRPPKEGSISARLPKDKLARKRAAARRYYHNQKNKAVDYEITIKKLEAENNELKWELVNALKKLEFLKQAQTQAHAQAIC